jgi:hypothetical protein
MGIGSLRLVRIASLTSMRNKSAGVIGHAVDTEVDPTAQRAEKGVEGAADPPPGST